MAKYIVATLAELPPGSRKLVEVAGRSIGVFNIAGEFSALRNRCPHQGGPLAGAWNSDTVWGGYGGRVYTNLQVQSSSRRSQPWSWATSCALESTVNLGSVQLIEKLGC